MSFSACRQKGRQINLTLSSVVELNCKVALGWARNATKRQTKMPELRWQLIYLLPTFVRFLLKRIIPTAVQMLLLSNCLVGLSEDLNPALMFPVICNPL